MSEDKSPPSRSSANAPLVVVEDQQPDVLGLDATEPGKALQTGAEYSAADYAVPDYSASEDAPAVVAVVVVTNPGECFGDALASLAAQDYANLSVLVIDASEAEPIADQVAGVLPDAYIHRVTGAPGFSAAANQALTLISGAAFLLFCHDDVALDARCTSALVEELYRSNAGLVGPKVVQWADRRRLQQIGRTADRFGVQVDLVEPDEFDQEQYDSVRDVFVVPAGVQLVRADLFAALGGFDPAIPVLGEDLDLCWRAHLAGARVMVVPAARARHLDEHPELGTVEERRRLSARHRLRSQMVCSSRSSLFKFGPLAILIVLAEALYCLVTGRRSQAAAAVGAISWNASRGNELRQRRREVQSARKVSDREVHALQVVGSARIGHFFRETFGSRQDRLTTMVGSVRHSLTDEDSKVDRDGILIAAFLSVVVVFGSRDLVSGGLVPVGQVPLLPSAGSMLGEWFGGWRSAGLGGPGNAPTAFVFLGLLKALFFWAPSLVDWIIIFGPLFIGSFSMWKLLAPFGSLRANALATAAYALNPIVAFSFASGRWESLVLFATLPLFVGSVFKAQNIAPYGNSGGPSGPGIVRRDLPTRLLRLGLLVFIVASFAPSVVPVAMLVILSMAIGTVLVARPAGLSKLALAALVSVVVPVALHIPWSTDVLRRFSWDWLIGAPSPSTNFDSLADLVRFAPDGQAAFLTPGLIMAAAVSLLIGRGRRFDVGVMGWSMALTFWLMLWAERRDLLPFGLPAPETMLMPAAAGMALAVGVGARSVEIDLRTHRFGWRQASVIAGLVGLLGFSLLGISESLGGRWGLPTHEYGSFTAQLEAEVDGPVRVLWLADPAVSLVDTDTTKGGTHFAVTDGGRPDVLSRWVPSGYGMVSEVGNVLDLAAAGETVRLGALLGLHGIDYIVVLDRLAPAPYEGPTIPADADPSRGVVAALNSQLDLERLRGIPNLVVYRNGESAGPVVALEGLAETTKTIADQLRVDLNSGARLDVESNAAGSWTGEGLDAQSVWISVASEGWTSTDDSIEVSSTPTGMLVLTPTEGTSIESFSVSHSGRGYRRIALLAQAILVGSAVVLAQTRREVE